MKRMRQSFVLEIALAVMVIAAGWSFSAGAGTAPQSGDVSPAATETDCEEDAPKNSLKWTTASEVENFGFDIFRSGSEDGQFEKMTERPLAGAGTTDEPQSYVWEDFDIEKGRDYFYYIESISMSGVRERFSPIIKAPAK